MSKELQALVERIAMEQGVDPVHAKAMVDLESGWNPRVQSTLPDGRPGAKGLMQLMDPTAQEMGVTDSFDPEQNVRGGLSYYKKLLAQFGGDVEKATTAYHSGAKNVLDGTLGPRGKEYYSLVSQRKSKYGGKSDEDLVNSAMSDEDLVNSAMSDEDLVNSAMSDEDLVNSAFEQTPKQEPTFMQMTGKAFRDSLKGAVGGAEQLVNAAGYESPQFLKDEQQRLSEGSVSDEQFANQSTATKIGASILGNIPPAIAAGALKLPGVAAFTALQAANIYKELIKAGESHERASSISGIQGAFMGIGIALPLGAKGFMDGVMKVLANPALGAAADVPSHLIAQTEQGKAMNDPTDLVRRGAELGMGAGAVAAGTMARPQIKPGVDLPPPKPVEVPELKPEGPGMYDPRLAQEQMEGAPRPSQYEVDENGMPVNRQLTEEIARTVEQEPDETRVMQVADSMGVGFEEARQYLKNGYFEEMGGPDAATRASKAEADIIYATKEQNARLDANKRQGAPELEKLGDEISIRGGNGKPILEGLPRETTVSELAARIAYEDELFSRKLGKMDDYDLRQTDFLNLIQQKIFKRIGDVPVRFNESIKAGEYDSDTHTIQINPSAYRSFAELRRVLTHEGIHATLARAQLDKKSPYARSTNFLYEKVMKELPNLERKWEDVDFRGPFGVDYPFGHYAFKNSLEFAAEITRPEFQEVLKAVTLTPSEQRQFYRILHGREMPPSASKLFNTAWRATTQVVKKLFNLKQDEFTALEGLMEVTTKMADSSMDFYKASVNFNHSWSSNHFTPKLESINAPKQLGYDSEAKGFLRDRRSFEEMAAVTPKPTIDIPTKAGTGSTTSTWKLLKTLVVGEHRKNASVIALKWGHDQLATLQEQNTRRFIEQGHLLKELDDTVRPGGNTVHAVGEMSYYKKLNQQMVRVALDLEQDFHTWFNGKDYFPDRSELIKRGLNERQIKAYETLAKITNATWDMLDAVYKISGRVPPKRTPGYIPHFWSGTYRVLLKDADGHISHIFKFNSSKDANRAMPTIEQQAQQHGLSFEFKNNKKIHEPDFDDDSIGSLLKSLHAVGDQMNSLAGKDPQKWAAILRAVENKVKEGTISEQFERLPRPVRGHELDLLANGNLKDISNKDFMKALSDRFKGVNDLLTATEAIHNVWRPLVENDYLSPDRDKNPKAFAVFDQQMRRFVGIDNNALKLVDAFFQRGIAAFGGDPNFARVAGAYINGSASVFYLTKSQFVWATITQPFRAINQMQFFDAMLTDMKHPLADKGSIIDAWGKAVTKGFTPSFFRGWLNNPDISKIKDPVIKEAILTGSRDPAMMNELFPERGLFKVMTPFKKLEVAGRLHVYITAYEYAISKGFKKQQAFDIAKELTDATMVPYADEFGRPVNFDHFGVFGKAATTFLTFSAHEIGSIYTQGKAIGTFESPAAKIKAAKALLTGLSIQALVGGVAAFPFAANFDDMIELVNNTWDTHYPDLKTMAMEWMDEKKIPDKKLREFLQNIVGFGTWPYIVQAGEQGVRNLIGKATGEEPTKAGLYHITGSMSGVSVMPPNAVYSMVSNLGALGALVGKRVIRDQQLSREEIREVTNKLPWFVKTPAEYILKNKNFEDAYKQLVLDQTEGNPDYITDNRNLPNKLGAERGPEDRSFIHFGARSINETKVNMVVRRILREVKKEDLNKNRALQLLKEQQIYNDLSPKELEAVFKQLEKYSVTGAPSAVMDYYKKNLPYDKFPDMYKRNLRKFEIYNKAREGMVLDGEADE